NDARSEVVVVTNTATFGAAIFFEAQFALAHDDGVFVTTMPYPLWASTKRHALIVLTSAAAADPEKRRRVHNLMRKIARGVSTWSICDGGAGKTNGPFRVGVGRLGVTTIGAVPF